MRWRSWLMGASLACGLAGASVGAQTPVGGGPSLEQERRAIGRGEFVAAEAELRRYLASEPRSAPAHKLLAYCLLRQNRPKESLPEYTRAAQIEPPTAEDLTNVAQDYVLLGDYSEAAKWLGISIEKDRADPEAWYNMGRVRYTQQRFGEAVACFRQTLVLAPRSVKAENNLGLALEGLNRNDEAIEAYRTAIAWAGSSAAGQRGLEQPLLNLAIALEHRDDVDGALPLLKQAAAVAPEDARIHEQLGQVYLKKEDLAEAQAELEQAVRLQPGSSALHFLLGQTYRRRGLAEKAQVEFARSAEILGTHGSKD